MVKIFMMLLDFIASYTVVSLVWNKVSLQKITTIRIQFAGFFRPKRVIDIWFLGKNNLDKFGYLTVASETGKYTQNSFLFEEINRSHSI
jgi:hypothetical protein